VSIRHSRAAGRGGNATLSHRCRRPFFAFHLSPLVRKSRAGVANEERNAQQGTEVCELAFRQPGGAVMQEPSYATRRAPSVNAWRVWRLQSFFETCT